MLYLLCMFKFALHELLGLYEKTKGKWKRKYNIKSSKYSKKWMRNGLWGMRVKGRPNKIQNTLYWRWIILQICTQIILELFIREFKIVLKFFVLTRVEEEENVWKIVFHVFQRNCSSDETFWSSDGYIRKNIFLETCFMNYLCNSKKERSKCLTLYSVCSICSMLNNNCFMFRDIFLFFTHCGIRKTESITHLLFLNFVVPCCFFSVSIIGLFCVPI